MYSLDDLALFVAVVDAHGFSAAARHLGISTPVISKRIAALESELDTRLLNRTTRRLSLTEAGAVFYEHGSRVMTQAQEAKAAVNFLNDAPRGVLRVTAPISFGALQLSRVVAGFLERYPEVQVELDLTDRVVDLAEEGYDLAIRLTKTPPPLLAARHLKNVRRLVCAAPAYWERHGRPQVPADLAQHQCVTYSLSRSYNEWSFKSAEGEEVISVRGRFTVNNTTAMLEATIGGAGVAMLTSLSIEREVRTGQLETVLTNYQTTDTDIYILYLPNRYLSNKARAFIDYLVENFGEP